MNIGTPAAGAVMVCRVRAPSRLLTVPSSVPLAVLAASRRDGIRDHVVRAVPLVWLGMPQFWLGFLLIYGFAISLRIFPVSGYGSGLTGHPAQDVMIREPMKLVSRRSVAPPARSSGRRG